MTRRGTRCCAALAAPGGRGPMAKGKELTVDQRWERGIPHDPRSVALYESIEDIDYKLCGDSFGFKSGGDGDNGETLMYLLDIHFARLDRISSKGDDK